MTIAPPLQLAPGEIQVWLAELDPDSPALEQAAVTLSLDEHRRAQRFHFEADRRRYILGRGFLRTILAQYVAQPAASLRFGYGANGKPALLEPEMGVEFNLSHAQNWALYCVTQEQAVGVDLEFLRPGFADELIAEQFFSEQECRELRALPEEQQCAAFFRCWTRKEAFVKTNGAGLTYGLQDFDVSLRPHDRACVRAIRHGGERAADWSLFAFEPVCGFIAAVAVKSPAARLVFQQRSPIALFSAPV